MEVKSKVGMSKNISGRAFNILLTMFFAVFVFLSYFVLNGCTSPAYDGAAPQEDASRTNVQEEGVDEADIVKVNADGYIFKAQRDGVTISKINKTDGMVQVITQKAFEGFAPNEMFLYQNKYLIVIGGRGEVGRYFDDEGNVYNYDFDTMSVDIYDLTDLSQGSIKLLRSDTFRGTYKTSRLIDGNIYLLTNYNSSYGEVYNDYFAGSVDFNVIYRDEAADTGSSFVGGYLIAMLGLDTDINTALYKTALYADKEVYDIYCSPYAFYSMKRGYYSNSYYRSYGCSYNPQPPADMIDLYYDGLTTDSIDRISLDTLERMGTVEGFNGLSPDRFCLYDNGNYLFVVNQRMFKEDIADERELGSYLYVFDADMNEVARLGPLASGEKLYSARISGDIAYLVTAKQIYMTVDPISLEPLPEPVIIDPLFKIDISEPLNPRYLGELEIEGFSTYMQSFGDDMLIGLGRDGSGENLKVSLFCTQNDEPSEINSLIFKNGYAEAETEARAILCEQDRNLFAFSARFVNEGTTEYGVLVLGLNNNELAQTAFLSEPYPNVDYSRQRIRRVARIGEYILTVSDAYIASYSLIDVLENGNAAPIDIADTRIKKDDIFLTVKFESGFDNLNYPDRLVEYRYFVTLPMPADIENEWEFGFWSIINHATLRSNGFSKFEPIMFDTTLYAKWYKLPWREVEFDINLPSNVQDNTLGTNGSSNVYLNTPSKQIVEDCGRIAYPYNLTIGTVIKGYKLTHWYKDDESKAFDFNTPIEESFTLYAYWQSIVTHTVTIEHNYPDKSVYKQVLTIEDGKQVPRPNVNTTYQTSDAIFKMDYWYSNKDKNSAYDFYSPVKEDITLSIKWVKAIAHKVTFNYNYPDGSNVKSVSIVENATTVASPYMGTYTVREGQLYVQYKFQYWYLANKESVPYNFSTPITKDITLYAKWEKIIL